MTAVGHIVTGAVIQKTLEKKWPVPLWLLLCFASHFVLDAICLWHPDRLMFGGGLWMGLFFWAFNIIGIMLILRLAKREALIGGLFAWLSVDFEWIVLWLTGRYIGLHSLKNFFFADDLIGALVEVLLTSAFIIFLWRIARRRKKWNR